MHIAPLTAADLPAYQPLMLHAYAAAADAFTSTAEERAAAPEAWWLQRVADPAGLGRAFGAFDDAGRLVGTVSVEFSAKPKTRHKALVIGMFVREAARGQGLGRRLLQAALDEAAARPGVFLVTLTVTEGNAPALALYRGAGFTVFGTEPLAIATPQGYRGKVHMVRQLADPPPLPAPPGA
ncbi:GNAT family N-acetyltransferase [Piscinibacter sakaiensis]|uniref:Acetyltransferase, GNAT family n=1 Tax=Piscinibacter sakaiensis TaxID=1547922 RepID=A0A0K8NXI9_PISS1|nr:GNAT family N-acetyltransferase [Piscinibacter sakaiensis]GAP35014.1 acetyltransferase, GNAT family [Piscinibacter sakaiensis]